MCLFVFILSSPIRLLLMLKLWKAFIMCIDIVLFVRMKHIKQKCYMNTCMRLKYILIEKLKGKQ